MSLVFRKVDGQFIYRLYCDYRGKEQIDPSLNDGKTVLVVWKVAWTSFFESPESKAAGISKSLVVNFFEYIELSRDVKGSVILDFDRIKVTTIFAH